MNIKRLLVLYGSFLAFFSAWAVPAMSELMYVEQPDGTILAVKLCGDEHYSYFTTADGCPVAADENGAYYYVTNNTADMQELASLLAHNAELRSAEERLLVAAATEQTLKQTRQRAKRRIAQQVEFAAHFPLRGEPHSLVVLMEFPDKRFVTSAPQQAFSRLLNESGYKENGGIGSARDYFIASSDSLFAPHFDVYGPFMAANSYEYYGTDAGDYHDQNVRVLIREACQAVVNDGVDLKQYDTDGDGLLDNVFVYYAGYNQAEWGGENTIWPHRSVVGNNVVIGGVQVYDYACTSELRGNAGHEMCGIGTFSHEFGHVLGLPDFYDTDDDDHYTVGMWDIMCSGSYNGSGKMPPSYTSFERFSLGWLQPTPLEDAGTYVLEPLEKSNKAYLIAATTHNLSASSPAPNEYFLVENRQQVGWDQWLPGTGMLLWHIDYNAAAWSNNVPNNSTPCRMHLQEADGMANNFSTAGDPYPGSQSVHACNPTLHDGTLLSPLFNIQEMGENIAFVYKSSDDTKLFFIPEVLDLFESTYDGTTQVADCQQVVLQGAGLKPDEAVVLTAQGRFELSLDSVSWTTDMQLPVGADSVLRQRLYVRYSPYRQVCDVASGMLAAQASDGMAVMSLQGVSPRPVMIAEPQIDSSYHLTPYSFEVHFVPQTDAEYYYATLYYLEDRVSTVMQSFEGFSNLADIAAQGWLSTTTTVTTTAKEDGNRSLWLQHEGDIVTSQLYAVPVTELSFWLNTMTTADNEVGILSLEAFNGAWVKIDDIEITRSLRKYTYSRSFAPENGYVRFRLTYEPLGGNGVALDAFRATIEKQLNYVYKGREKTIKARNGVNGIDPSRYSVCLFTALNPDTDYYVQLQCSESKGCTEHVSDLSEPYLVHTLKGAVLNSPYLTVAIDSVSYNRVSHVVYLPDAEGERTLYIYDVMGHLVWQHDVVVAEYAVTLPTEKFISGNVYIVKYSLTDKLKRKDKWVKIMF